jgi:hypothetical protein
MVYDMVGGYGIPTREKDAVQHLLMFTKPTQQPAIATGKRSTSTTISTTTEGTTEPTSSVTLPRVILSDPTYRNMSIQSDMTDEHFDQSFPESSQTLPYRYIALPEEDGSKQDIRFSNIKSGRTPRTNLFIRHETRNTPRKQQREGTSPATHEKVNYSLYWLPPHTLGTEPVIEKRITSNGNNPVPRPFRARNLTTQRPARNRVKIFKNDPQVSLPHHGISSSGKYPQISKYRYPNEAKNIQDIITYLTADDSNKPSPSNNKQETIALRVPAGNGRKIKFAGVYKTAEKEDYGKKHGSPKESMEDALTSSNQNKMSDSLLNGHAYTADRFHAFKPSDPAEINLLANSDFRFAPIENRIPFANNRPRGTRLGVLEINPNDKYFPRPPINFGKLSSAPPSHDVNHETEIETHPGTYTSAIYRPLGKEPATTTSHSSKKMKPFSVMLDIYPMIDDPVPQATSGPRQHLQSRPFEGPSHGSGHHVGFPPGGHRGRLPEHATDSESKHQMVVHLNLYPRKKKNHNFSNR